MEKAVKDVPLQFYTEFDVLANLWNAIEMGGDLHKPQTFWYCEDILPIKAL